MNDVDLSYFQEVGDDEVVTFKPRVISHKSEAAIQTMIDNNRPQKAIESHADLFVQHEQWAWLDDYNMYQAECDAVTTRNLTPTVIGYEDEEETLPVYADEESLPELPVRPIVRTGVELLTSMDYYANKAKAERTDNVAAIKSTVDEVTLDGDEESQTRLTRAIVVFLAQKVLALEDVIKTANSSEEITTTELLSQLNVAIETNAATPWVAADNSVVQLDCKTAMQFLADAGTQQTNMWRIKDA